MKRYRSFRLFVPLLFLLTLTVLPLSVVGQAPVRPLYSTTLYANADTYVYQGDPSANHGDDNWRAGLSTPGTFAGAGVILAGQDQVSAILPQGQIAAGDDCSRPSGHTCIA